jgi:hypothetical protein
VTGVPIVAAVSYAWSVSGAGAIAVPPTNSWALQVKLGKTATPVSIGVQVVVEGVQRSAQISYVPDTEQIVRMRELFCEIRSVVQVNWWIDPLWDPLRDLVLQPYSPIELQRMVALGRRLSTLANEALLLERSAPPVTALGPAARRYTRDSISTFADLFELFSKPTKSPQRAFRTYQPTFKNGEPVFTLSAVDRILEGVCNGCRDRLAAKHGRIRRCKRAIWAWRDGIGGRSVGESEVVMRAWALPTESGQEKRASGRASIADDVIMTAAGAATRSRHHRERRR